MEYSSLQQALIATGTHVPYAINKCYLPPDRADIPAFTHSQLKFVLDLMTPEECWVDRVGLVTHWGGHTEVVYPLKDGHPSQ